MNSYFWRGVLSAYALTGAVLAWAMHSVVPALNFLGVVYYAVFWPVWPVEVVSGQNILPLFNWMYEGANQ
jgi:hypothetical protein